MRAYQVAGKGPGSLSLIERASPRPGPGQVVVRVRAASLNYRDLLVLDGRYGRGGIEYPRVPLSDAAGEVIEVGPAVRSLALHDRVIGNFFQKWSDGPFDPEKGASALGGPIDGVLAEEVVFEENATVKIPSSLSYEEAATLPCAGLTAWVGLVDIGGLAAGQVVLAQGTGGVSLFSLQIAKAMGARVILTSSQEQKLARGRALGADETIDYRATPHWDVRARELTGGNGVDQLLEVVGKDTVPMSLRAVRRGGHLVLVGLLSGERPDEGQAASNDRGVLVHSVYVGSTAQLRAFAAFVERSALHPMVDRTFAFEEAPAAFEHLRSGAHFGKIVITV